MKQLVAEVVTPRTIEEAVAAEADRSVRARIHTPITVAETPAATVSVADTVTVVAANDTAVVTASPTVTISAPPRPVDDEPSDGVVRGMLDSARRPPPPPEVRPEHDGPPVKETTGEIREPVRRPAVAAIEQPSIMVEQASIVIDQPSMLTSEPLVADMAAVHAAAAAAARAPMAAGVDAASSSRELAVAEVRKDAAIAETDAEAAFFNRVETGPVPMSKVESFDDLDEGYEPPKFWDRVFGRKPPKKR